MKPVVVRTVQCSSECVMYVALMHRLPTALLVPSCGRICTAMDILGMTQRSQPMTSLWSIMLGPSPTAATDFWTRTRIPSAQVKQHVMQLLVLACRQQIPFAPLRSFLSLKHAGPFESFKQTSNAGSACAKSANIQSKSNLPVVCSISSRTDLADSLLVHLLPS